MDGATGCNNPVNELWTEAQYVWPETDLRDNIQCMVSIGTGESADAPFVDYPLEIVATLKAIALETESTAKTFAHHHGRLIDEKKYFRFSVVKGLEHVGLHEYTKEATIIAATKKYSEDRAVFKNLEACAKNLRDRESWLSFA